jgi:L-lactate dehydrogenase (cytochrome)
VKDILSLDDFERAARARLPAADLRYVSGGAEDNVTREGNRAAFDRYGFVPRVLTDVSKRNAATTLFGRQYAMPVGIAPMGIVALSAYRGDLVLARAARAANVPMVLSGTSLIRLEEVAKENPDAWFQAYLPGEPARIAALLDRVAAAGFGTLVVTVDVAVLPSRENNVRAGFSTPLRPSLRLAWDGLVRPRWLLGTWFRTLLNHGMPHFENSFAERGVPILARNVDRDFSKRDHLDWKHLEQIRRQWKGPLVVKGVMNPADARLARESGADGIIVSNHGGRQLEGTAPALQVLPEIARDAGAMTVMIDGGFRRGTHVLKALALGAKFVFVGRPFNYAAAVGGEAGVAHALKLLALEVDRDMALLGVTSIADIGPDRLVRV